MRRAMLVLVGPFLVDFCLIWPHPCMRRDTPVLVTLPSINLYFLVVDYYMRRALPLTVSLTFISPPHFVLMLVHAELRRATLVPVLAPLVFVNLSQSYTIKSPTILHST